ncbi:MAG: O-antigen ligase family protein, partial [Acidimicrobiales bacterium]
MLLLGTVDTVADHIVVGAGRDSRTRALSQSQLSTNGSSRTGSVGLLLPEADGPLPEVTHLRADRKSHLPARPGILERSLTVLTLFVLEHSTPNTWFLTSDDGTVESSNPLYVVVVGVLILAGLSRVMGYFNQIINVVNLDLAIFGFVGLCLLSSLWSANLMETFESALLFAAMTSYAFYMVMRYSLEEILVLISFVFLISGVLNIAFVGVYPQFGLMEDGEWSGVFGSKNQLGYLATMGIPTLLITSMIHRRWRLALLGGAAMLAFLLIMSQSTTALIATILLSASLLAFRSFRASYTLRGAAILMVFGNGLIMTLVATNQIELVAGWAGKDPSLTGRTPLWEATLDVILERPVIGYGYQAAFGGYFSPTHEVWILNDWEPGDSHNALLQIWIEVGLI